MYKRKPRLGMGVCALFLAAACLVSACSKEPASSVQSSLQGGTDQTESYQTGTEQAETNHSGTGQTETHQAGTDQAETHQSETHQERTNPGGTNQAETHRDRTYQDGVYVPEAFTAVGGSGKVTITCPEVTVEEGAARAVLEFSSPHYEWVKVAGRQYAPENAAQADRQNSIFQVPVLLDEEMTISGLTTAMSEPHEIEYRIFISLEAQEAPAGVDMQETSAGKTGQEASAGKEEQEISAGKTGQEAQEISAGEKTSASDPAGKAGMDSRGQSSEPEAPPDLPGLTFVSAMEKAYAEGFDIYAYRREDLLAEEDAKEAQKAQEEKDAKDAKDLKDAEGAEEAEGAEDVKDVEGAEDAEDTVEAEAAEEVDAAEAAQEIDTAEEAEAAEESVETAKEEEKALYRLLDVHGSGQYLLLPRGQTVPDLQALKERGITILQLPLDNLYVAATSSMALFDAAGAIGQVRLTGTKAEGWYIDAPKKALEEGKMVYAGKYSAPDYELMASSGCDLAVESMMILHAPEVKEKLEELGIPVFIDTSSNESHPLGRTEWVRLYGVLTGHEEEAEAFFAAQREKFAQAQSYEKTDLSVAFFSISSNGNVIVRAADDYIPRMIGIAGGTYAFENLLKGTGNSASVRLSMEDFYNTAKDADFLIYNATIEKPVGGIAELCGLSPLLADFSAVRSGRVWQVRRSLYQSPDLAVEMIADIHGMLTGKTDDGMVFLEKID